MIVREEGKRVGHNSANVGANKAPVDVTGGATSAGLNNKLKTVCVDKTVSSRKLILFRFFPVQIILHYIQNEKYQVMQTDTIYFIHPGKNLSW